MPTELVPEIQAGCEANAHLLMVAAASLNSQVQRHSGQAEFACSFVFVANTRRCRLQVFVCAHTPMLQLEMP